MPHEALLAAALEVRERAYAPFSRFKVGAAVQTADGRIFPGCNVENSSYGLSICAERSAAARSVAEGGGKIVAVAVVADTDLPCPPCGACRQVLSDLGPDCEVLLANLRGDTQLTTITRLLPGAFHADMLPQTGERER